MFLQGCLPLVLMFDIKEDIEVEPQCITSLMEQLDVFISIKPKPKQPSKVCKCTKTDFTQAKLFYIYHFTAACQCFIIHQLEKMATILYFIIIVVLNLHLDV